MTAVLTRLLATLSTNLLANKVAIPVRSKRLIITN